MQTTRLTSSVSSEGQIVLTALAIQNAKRKLLEAEEEVVGLRVGVKGGGCNGYAYVFDFAKKVNSDRDQVFEFEGLKVIVDKKSLEFLRGATLDWETKLMGYGFRWKNPNTTDACGCGDSFNVA